MASVWSNKSHGATILSLARLHSINLSNPFKGKNNMSLSKYQTITKKKRKVKRYQEEDQE
jgi:hypothetical protein